MKDLLQSRLYAEIPITRQMGLKVVKADSREVTITAPLEPNINHKATAFGGTIASALLLSGWGLAEVRLRAWGLRAHVVVMKTEIEYLLPVEGDFSATCSLEDEQVWEDFYHRLTRKNKARLKLEGTVHIKGEIAARFSALYVAMMENMQDRTASRC